MNLYLSERPWALTAACAQVPVQFSTAHLDPVGRPTVRRAEVRNSVQLQEIRVPAVGINGFSAESTGVTKVTGSAQVTGTKSVTGTANGMAEANNVTKANGTAKATGMAKAQVHTSAGTSGVPPRGRPV